MGKKKRKRRGEGEHVLEHTEGSILLILFISGIILLLDFTGEGKMQSWEEDRWWLTRQVIKLSFFTLKFNGCPLIRDHSMDPPYIYIYIYILMVHYFNILKKSAVLGGLDEFRQHFVTTIVRSLPSRERREEKRWILVSAMPDNSSSCEFITSSPRWSAAGIPPTGIGTKGDFSDQLGKFVVARNSPIFPGNRKASRCSRFAS